MDKQYITKAGMEKLISQLEEWRNQKRPAMVKQLASARSHGDLSENAEYHAAREELTRIDQRILHLEKTLQSAIVVDETQVNTDQVRVFTRVRVLDNAKNVEREYSIVSAAEADAKAGRISHQSPVGQGLIGSKVGETVEITVPAGIVKWTILEILPIQLGGE
ncbi:transcription elongation factor GreA [bacterium]|nr:transcription elongation factor GreA [bacterium]MBU1983719.1 transcription elongation factor GreA [bacterium]